ncbi:MAG: hydrogenase formation protein HypD [Bacillota bacterium]|nr:hydrogenase formation protein HypD [Bacillota bacterium]
MYNFMDEFRNSDLARQAAEVLASYKGRPVKIMEVCGTHTMAIFKYGIRSLLPQNISLISGPGCPVCVTPVSYIDSAIELSRLEGMIITTFGDLMKVPGTESSLLKEKAAGRDIRIIYSPLDAVRIAAENPVRKVVFLSVGFETTTPVTALTVLKAYENQIGNFSILTANKTMPEALKILAVSGEVKIDGYLYPGHVSTITGTELYWRLAEEYGISGIVTGFEPLDMLNGIIMLIDSLNKGKATVINEYSRAVTKEGNPIALGKMYEVFEPCDAIWRGIGNIPASGLGLKEKYKKYDARVVYEIKEKDSSEPKGCLCGEILKGNRIPRECGFFGKQCTPENPVGACMVSSEGTCAAYYKFGGIE